MLVQGIASVEGEGHAAASEASGVAPPTPRVVAQPLHGVAANGGRQVALVVLEGVVHLVPSCRCGHKDSE